MGLSNQLFKTLTAALLVLSPLQATAQRIMAVGDSITEGFTTGSRGTASYRLTFEQLISDCDAEMVGGESTNYTANGASVVFNGRHEGWSGHTADHILLGRDKRQRFIR